MSTFSDRPNRALVVVDMQVGVVGGAYKIDEVTETIKDVVARARAADVPVVWVQDDDGDHRAGTPGGQLVEGLEPVAGEALVSKRYGDAFAETDLEDVLAARGVGRLVLVGAASEQCIRSTLHSAVIAGYDVDLVKGAHTTSDLSAYGMPEPSVVVGFMDLLAEHGMQWPGRRGRAVAPEDLDL
ncbi:Nicotinamidase-related amidase [Microlunatus sagamiharensis]|uniref:Nicotinamidase-related amidase n=1 Tax=Microlunatus sagamiharensis TaxID=546874 RepID=A0A1H2M516_9ACTN|nr:isochorismatase family protein [Microlunatus sagamiharensis]SDU88350.1 Nicotinamidase-related amidase [Microlunatus sagamiharensis]